MIASSLISCLGCKLAQGPPAEPAVKWCNARLGLRYEKPEFGGPYRPRANVRLLVGLDDRGRVAWMKPPAGFVCPAGAPQEIQPSPFALTSPPGFARPLERA
jgi:hypothetical protein